jgi:hypothetical protein
VDGGGRENGEIRDSSRGSELQENVVVEGEASVFYSQTFL